MESKESDEEYIVQEADNTRRALSWLHVPLQQVADDHLGLLCLHYNYPGLGYKTHVAVDCLRRIPRLLPRGNGDSCFS